MRPFIDNRRVATENEVMERFLKKVHQRVEYWSEVDTRNEFGKLEGLAFSIMAMLDGCDIDLPKFVVAPDPHLEDYDFNLDRGAIPYPDNNHVGIECDLGGTLHDNFYYIKEKMEMD